MKPLLKEVEAKRYVMPAYENLALKKLEAL
jgi:hypothetical protein